jgi:hypothetical protein
VLIRLLSSTSIHPGEGESTSKAMHTDGLHPLGPLLTYPSYFVGLGEKKSVWMFELIESLLASHRCSDVDTGEQFISSLPFWHPAGSVLCMGNDYGRHACFTFSWEWDGVARLTAYNSLTDIVGPFSVTSSCICGTVDQRSYTWTLWWVIRLMNPAMLISS